MTDTFCKDMLRRRQLAIDNKPFMRNELVNPYPELPPKYATILRKVEILKYSNNVQATKTNNFTKKELWSRLAKGNVQRISENNITNLESDDVGYT